MKKDLLVFLADDHKVVSEALKQTMEALDLVRSVVTFEQGKELYQKLQVIKPDLVFLDVDMPVWSGSTTVERITRDYPKIKCIMLSMSINGNIIQTCLNNGARGYIAKNSPFSEIETAIHAVLRDEIYLSQEAKSALNFKNDYELDSGNKVQLSQRELEILRLLCDGLNPKEISEQTGISHRTVETHKANIMLKFEVNSTVKLISFALRKNIV